MNLLFHGLPVQGPNRYWYLWETIEFFLFWYHTRSCVQTRMSRVQLNSSSITIIERPDLGQDCGRSSVLDTTQTIASTGTWTRPLLHCCCADYRIGVQSRKRRWCRVPYRWCRQMWRDTVPYILSEVFDLLLKSKAITKQILEIFAVYFCRFSFVWQTK